MLRHLPNLLTGLRLLLVPGVVGCVLAADAWSALWLFVAAGITDALDGFLARLLKAQSTLGEILDPVADKALLSGAYVAMAMMAWMPVWLVVLVVVRDLAILLIGLRLRLAQGPVSLPPTWLGKLNTVLQVGYGGLVMGGRALGLDLEGVTPIMGGAVAVVALASGLSYLRLLRLGRLGSG